MILEGADECGVLTLSNSCAFQYSLCDLHDLTSRIVWEPFVLCISRVPTPQRRTIQATCKQLGTISFHCKFVISRTPPPQILPVQRDTILAGI